MNEVGNFELTINSNSEKKALFSGFFVLKNPYRNPAVLRIKVHDVLFVILRG